MEKANKSNNFLKTMKNNIQYSFAKYCVTLLLLMIFTVILLIINNTKKYSYIYDNFSDISKILVFFTFEIFNTFVVETFADKFLGKIWKKIIAYVCTVVISLLFTFFSVPGRYIAGYFITFSVVSLVKLIKNSKLEIHEYAVKVSENLMKTGIIYAILQIACVMITGLITTLLISGDTGFINIYLNMEIILLTLFLIPACIISINNVSIKISKFMEALIKYILVPIEILFTLIIYIYAVKILVTSNFPVNEIFEIITAIFAFSLIVWVFQFNYKEENKFYNKICTIMPYSFIPLWIFQTYSLMIRIVDYGVTEKRYLGIMLLIFEGVCIILSVLKNRKYFIHVFGTIIVLSMISFIIPGINMEDISNYSQSKRYKEDRIYIMNDEVIPNLKYESLEGSEDHEEDYNNILYEKDFGEKSIRIIYKESILAQRSIIGVEKSEDGGITWQEQIEDPEKFIVIHNGAQYEFTSVDVGFINDHGLAGTEGENRNLLVTTDGGKTFEDANIIHPEEIKEENFFIDGVPYIEDGLYKMKVYTINNTREPEREYYIFESRNAIDWTYSGISIPTM